MLTISELPGSSVQFWETQSMEECNLKFWRFCTEVQSKDFRFKDEIVQEYLKPREAQYRWAVGTAFFPNTFFLHKNA